MGGRRERLTKCIDTVMYLPTQYDRRGEEVGPEERPEASGSRVAVTRRERDAAYMDIALGACGLWRRR